MLKSGDIAMVDANKGEISKSKNKNIYKSEVFPKFIKEMISAGGLMKYAKKRKKKERL